MTPLEQLGKDVASALRSGPGAERRGRQRAALRSVDFARRLRSRRALLVVPLFAAMLAGLALFWAWSERSPRGAIELAGDPALREARWLEAANDGLVRLRFKDGTELDLEPKSAGRMGSRSSAEARLTLEHGRLRARVVPVTVTGRSWTFEAGPYEVLVVGTELAIAWSSERGRLSVEVQHGSVHVRGGQLGTTGIVLGSGDRLEAEPGRIEVRRAAASAEAPSATEAPSASTAAERPSAELGSAAPPKSKPVEIIAGSATAMTPSEQLVAGRWMALARAGNYEEALNAADREGFDDLVAHLPAADLALLSDVARLGGAGARARHALLTLRHRFPGVDAAHLAAFRLGRLALSDRDYAGASRWFQAYLAEAPSGALASEATGRLVEARSRAGDRAGAEESARDYLRRFPGGPYEALARGMLRGDKLAPRNEGRTDRE